MKKNDVQTVYRYGHTKLLSLTPNLHIGISYLQVTLIIAPTFFSAALYITLMRLISIIGPEYSPLQPKTYVVFFVAADVL